MFVSISREGLTSSQNNSHQLGMVSSSFSVSGGWNSVETSISWGLGAVMEERE